MSNIYKQQTPESVISFGNANLIFDFRRLWLDLVGWTRTYVSSIMSGFGDATANGERLYAMPREFGNRIRMIFGEEAEQTFITFLSNHIILMMSLASAMKNGNNELVSSLTTQIYQNADEFSAFLDRTNAFWDTTPWQNLLYQYISLQLERMVALASGDFNKAVQIYDRLTYHAIQIADDMSNGVLQYLSVRG